MESELRQKYDFQIRHKFLKRHPAMKIINTFDIWLILFRRNTRNDFEVTNFASVKSDSTVNPFFPQMPDFYFDFSPRTKVLACRMRHEATLSVDSNRSSDPTK